MPGRCSEPVIKFTESRKTPRHLFWCFPVFQGKDLTFNAKDGKVIFESGECDTTDLCDLTRQVNALTNRLV